MIRFTEAPCFTGLDVIVVEDDDERMANIDDSSLGTDGRCIYVRRTLWDRIEVELQALGIQPARLQ